MLYFWLGKTEFDTYVCCFSSSKTHLSLFLVHVVDKFKIRGVSLFLFQRSFRFFFLLYKNNLIHILFHQFTSQFYNHHHHGALSKTTSLSCPRAFSFVLVSCFCRRHVHHRLRCKTRRCKERKPPHEVV